MVIMESFFPILIVFLLAVLIPVLFIGLSYILGPKSKNPIKAEPYECGVDTIEGNARSKINVKFYLVVLSFLIFDVEIAFLFPWAVLFKKLSDEALMGMAFFLAVLILGLIYEFRKGVLKWE